MGCAATSGARLVLMEHFEPERCLQLIQEQGITFLYAVPQILSTLSEWPQLDAYDLHTVRFTQCGAAPVPPALAHRFQERTHITVMTSYGLTEAAPGTHSNPVYDPRLIKVETIGLPIHDTLLLEHPAVVDVAVIAKPDEEAREVPKAFVVLRVGYEHVSPAELLAWANGKLATFKNVREIEFVEAIPRNPSGKILRRVLKQQERQRMGLS